VEILNQHEWPEDCIQALVVHGWGLCSDVEPLTDLEKTIYAIDEPTGLVNAAGANRAIIEQGSTMLAWHSTHSSRTPLKACGPRPKQLD
jgi:predicted hydrolase (HD superfamily)